MYEDGKKQIKSILALVEECPTSLKEKCFEILLKGYVDKVVLISQTTDSAATIPLPPPPADQLPPGETDIPEVITPRFKTSAKRLKVTEATLSDLFDFTVEPFTYHALDVAGRSKAAKLRNVALLLAFKGYLVTGKWKADWGEFKAMSVDQTCYDRNNTATNMNHEYFKSASLEEGVSLSSSGIAAAEELLKSMLSTEE